MKIDGGVLQGNRPDEFSLTRVWLRGRKKEKEKDNS